jgi:hypothetical protein
MRGSPADRISRSFPPTEFELTFSLWDLMGCVTPCPRYINSAGY